MDAGLYIFFELSVSYSVPIHLSIYKLSYLIYENIYKDGCFRSKERIRIYSKIRRSMKRFFFLIYSFCSYIRVIYIYIYIYIYVSSLLLSSENICGTRPC